MLFYSGEIIKSRNVKAMTSKRQRNTQNVPVEPKVRIPRWEMLNDNDGLDTEKLFLCPYDPNHQIRACRFPYHLIKCKKNHPKLASELQTCPFNACHLMPKHELPEHMKTCVNRSSIDIDYMETAETKCKFQFPVSTWTFPILAEDWDMDVLRTPSLTEEENSAEPGKALDCGVSALRFSQNRNEPAINSVTHSVRAPKVLPWKINA